MQETNDINLHRRRFLSICGAAATVIASPLASAAVSRPKGVRTLSLYNLNTTERLKADYWIDGRYQSDVLEQLNRLLRDHKSETVGSMDKGLLDLMFNLSKKLGANKEIEIICGYRASDTNAQMRKAKKGVAKNSYHVKGMAVDLRIPGKSLADVYHVAREMKVGGVGYYGKSNFVHVDVGPVRTWGPKPKLASKA